MQSQTHDAPPNETLYVNNINDRIKIDQIKKSLYSAFSQFGKILDLIVMKNFRLRGQAWIVYEDVSSATNALRQMNSFQFYEKPLRIQFAKVKSDAITKRNGTFKPREKRKREEKPVSVAPKPKPQTNSAPSNARRAAAQNPPNKILFLEDLPEQCDEQMLTVLFQQYHGFKEVRMVPGKKGLAFVEYSDEVMANGALKALSGFKVTPTEALKVSFAKK